MPFLYTFNDIPTQPQVSGHTCNSHIPGQVENIPPQSFSFSVCETRVSKPYIWLPDGFAFFAFQSGYICFNVCRFFAYWQTMKSARKRSVLYDLFALTHWAAQWKFFPRYCENHVSISVISIYVIIANDTKTVIQSIYGHVEPFLSLGWKPWTRVTCPFFVLFQFFIKYASSEATAIKMEPTLG